MILIYRGVARYNHFCTGLCLACRVENVDPSVGEDRTRSSGYKNWESVRLASRLMPYMHIWVPSVHFSIGVLLGRVRPQTKE